MIKLAILVFTGIQILMIVRIKQNRIGLKTLREELMSKGAIDAGSERQ